MTDDELRTKAEKVAQEIVEQHECEEWTATQSRITDALVVFGKRERLRGMIAQAQLSVQVASRPIIAFGYIQEEIVGRLQAELATMEKGEEVAGPEDEDLEAMRAEGRYEAQGEGASPMT